jgi:oligoendopeptidase F
MRWNLDDIYTSYDSPAFQADTARIGELAKGLNAWSGTGLAGDPADVLLCGVRKFEEYRLLLGRLYAYCYLRNTVDADDTVALACMERLAAVDSEAVRSVALFRQYLLGLGNGLDEAIAQEPKLAEFAFFLRESRAYARYMLPADVESALSIMEITGSQAWSNLQNSLVSTLTAEVELEGEAKTLTLPMIRNLAVSPDPEVRRKA